MSHIRRYDDCHTLACREKQSYSYRSVRDEAMLATRRAV